MPVFSVPAFGIGWIIAIVLIVGFSLLVEYIRNRNLEVDNVEETIEDRVVLRMIVPQTEEDTAGKTENLLQALHGLVGSRQKSYSHFSLEVSATEHGIQFYIICHPRNRKFIENQIYASFPFAEIDEVNDYILGLSATKSAGIHTYAAEIEYSKEYIFPIRTYPNVAADTMSLLTAAMQRMNGSDMLACQLVLRPFNDSWQRLGKGYIADIQKGIDPHKNTFAKRFRKLLGRIYAGIFSVRQLQLKPIVVLDAGRKDELDQVMQKANQPGFEFCIRLLASSKDQEVALENLQSTVSAFEGLNVYELNSFRSRIYKDEGHVSEIVTAYKTRFLDPEISDILSAQEGATLFHLPSLKVSTANILWLKAKRAEAPLNLPTDPAIYIGETNYRGQAKKFGLLTEDRRNHMYIVGKSGSGKTTLLENMVLQDIAVGRGVGVIDPHGDLVASLLQRVPEDRKDDVVLLDAADTAFPFSCNIFSMTSLQQPDFIASSILEAFKKNSDSWGPRLEYILHNAIMTLLTAHEGSMLSIPRLLTDYGYRMHILAKVSDPMLHTFWEDEYAQMGRNARLLAEVISPIQTRVGRLLASPIIRGVIGQEENKVDMAALMNQQKIILCNLAQGSIGEESATLLGSLLITMIEAATMARASLVEHDRQDFYLYIDEFQLFPTMSFLKIFSEARKYHLNLIVAHQYLSQLKDEIKAAIWGNIGTLVSFMVGNNDAKELAKEFFPVFSEHDLLSLDKYHMYVKELIQGQSSQPFSAISLRSDMPQTNCVEGIRAQSRAQYALPQEDVLQSMRQWMMKSFSVRKRTEDIATPLPLEGKVKPLQKLRLH